MLPQIIFRTRGPSDEATSDLSYLKTFFKRDIIHPLHFILSPIPFIAEPHVIFSSCLPLPFISQRWGRHLHSHVCGRQYHQTIVVYAGTLAFLYCCLEKPELRGRNGGGNVTV